MRIHLRFQACALGLVLCASFNCALAEVVPVVSARSSVTSLSRSQVADIFLGKARRFPNGVAAQPIDHAEGAVARDEFYSRFASKSPAQIKAHWSKIIFTGRGQPPAAAPNSLEVKKRVAENPAAIGYIDRALLDASVREIR